MGNSHELSTGLRIAMFRNAQSVTSLCFFAIDSVLIK